MKDLDERRARAAWSRIVEPTDAAAAGLIHEVGAVVGLRRLLASRSERTAAARARWEQADLDNDLRRAETVAARIVIPGDDEWPSGLDSLERPPYCLWVRGGGHLANIAARSISMVGARAATSYGRHCAGEWAAQLGTRGYHVVSGAAYGIDAAAHEGALSAGASTVAVLASGVDRPYPSGHSALLHDIAATGVVLSEVPPGSAPTKYRFLHRNRLIATMSVGTVVIEAGHRSGSRNTASTAARHGRYVAAMPGPVTSASSAGCHEMIREGMACLVADVDDLLDVMGRMGLDASASKRGSERIEDALDETDRRVWDALPLRGAASTDSVGLVAGVAVDQVRASLGRLSLSGLAVHADGGWRKAPRSGSA